MSPLLRLPDLETISVPLDVAAVPVAEEASPIQDSISASGPQKKKRAKKDSSQSVPAPRSRKVRKAFKIRCCMKYTPDVEFGFPIRESSYCNRKEKRSSEMWKMGLWKGVLQSTKRVGQ